MKKENKVLLIGMSLYTISIILFGNFENYFKYPLLLLCIGLVYYYFYRKKIDRKKWYGPFLPALILGLTLGFFNLNPFTAYVNKTILSISLSYSNIFGYWIGLISPIITSTIYHDLKSKRLYEEFNGDKTRISRQDRLDN